MHTYVHADANLIPIASNEGKHSQIPLIILTSDEIPPSVPAGVTLLTGETTSVP